LRSVVPSLPGACKSGALFAAARIASESFFTIPCATANSAGSRPKSHLPDSSLRLELAAMPLALFQRHKTDHEKQDHGANADKNYNGDYTDRPFNTVRPFTLSPQMNTDRTQITDARAGQSGF
jgi:hypothetical protein